MYVSGMPTIVESPEVSELLDIIRSVRFPRMARWRTDKRPEEADTLETVQALIGSEEEGP